MKSLLIVVYDKLGDIYTAPITTENDLTAKRWFAGICKQKGDDCSDFELYGVGYYDFQSGIIELVEHKVLLQKGVDYFVNKE